MQDFNLHIRSSPSEARQLTGVLESFDLDQYINFPTHVHRHSLDLVIFSKRCDVLSTPSFDKISDHFPVVTDLNIPTNSSCTVPKPIKYRKLNAINIVAFKAA